MTKPRILKTQYRFIQKFLDITKDLEIPGDTQPLMTSRNPFEVINVDMRLETGHKNRDVALSVLKYLALERIAARYPLSHWLHMFTDDSQFDCRLSVTAAWSPIFFHPTPLRAIFVPPFIEKLWRYV